MQDNNQSVFVIAYLAVAASGGIMGLLIGLLLGWAIWA